MHSLAAKAFEELRQAIINNRLPANTRLGENYWARKLGVSRITIREAFNRLLGENLVVKHERRGYFVKAHDPAELRDICELWGVLERGAMRLAFQKMDDTQFKTLECLCDDFSTMFSKGYFNGASDAARKFQEVLIDYAQNEQLRRLYESSQIVWLLRGSKKIAEVVIKEPTDVKFKKMIKALKEKDVSLAEETIDSFLSAKVAGENSATPD
jgi:DNA-binding GntR family transcriptional regulator